MKNFFNYARMFCLGVCVTLMATIAMGRFHTIQLICIALVWGLCFGFFMAGFFNNKK